MMCRLQQKNNNTGLELNWCKKKSGLFQIYEITFFFFPVVFSIIKFLPQFLVFTSKLDSSCSTGDAVA